MRRTAALIVGGGPAGSAAAITLARASADTLIIERHAEPADALCGGFVSWRTRAQLERLGIGRDALGGETIVRLRLIAGRRCVEAALPDEALGVSRRRLDVLLFDRAKAEGAGAERGAAVRSARPGEPARLADGREIAFDALFLATGKHDFKSLPRPEETSGKGWMGLRFRYAATPALRRAIAGTIELHLFAGGYAGLLLQEDGTANLCMAVRRGRLGEAGGDPETLLDELGTESPQLGERIDATGPLLSRDAIGLVPYGWRARRGEPALFRIGDQAAVIPSLAGEGIGIALASGASAARAFLAGGEASAAFQTRFAAQSRRPLAAAGAIKAMADSPIGARALLSLARFPGLAGAAARLTRIGGEHG